MAKVEATLTLKMRWWGRPVVRVAKAAAFVAVQLFRLVVKYGYKSTVK